MSMYSVGFVPPAGDLAASVDEFEMLFDNIDLVLAHRAEILACSDYFFCPLPFAHCSWPYITGDGLLCLGYLLLGWQNGILTEPCAVCGSGALITSFAGSPLSGTTRWTGFCQNCRDKRKGSRGAATPGSGLATLARRAMFVSELRRVYPETIVEWEEYDDFVFSWSGAGLKPARKKRQVSRPLYTPANLAELINELLASSIRRAPAPLVSEIGGAVTLKALRNSLGVFNGGSTQGKRIIFE